VTQWTTGIACELKVEIQFKNEYCRRYISSPVSPVHSSEGQWLWRK